MTRSRCDWYADHADAVFWLWMRIRSLIGLIQRQPASRWVQISDVFRDPLTNRGVFRILDIPRPAHRFKAKLIFGRLRVAGTRQPKGDSMEPTSGGGVDQRFQPTITFVADTPPRLTPIDPNTASTSNLTALPGVGPATARRILAARRRRPFLDPSDLVTRGLVRPTAFDDLMARARTEADARPYIQAVKTAPERVMHHRPYKLAVHFDDSPSGVRIVRLQVESMSHSLDLVQEVSDGERDKGVKTFELPPMEAGVMNIEASIYDNAGNKDYVSETEIVYHNPPVAAFWPSERTARLSRGAALFRGGSFQCNSNFLLANGTGAATSLNRTMTWTVRAQSGAQIHSGSWDWGGQINLAAFQVRSGFWFNFTFPPGSAGFNELQAKRQITIQWRFTETGTGAAVVDDLTWRGVIGPDVNIIRVGEEDFSPAERTGVFNALRTQASSIFNSQDMDIGTIRTFIITVREAGGPRGYVTINSNGEAEDLTEDWTVPNNAIDMFVVRLYTGSVAGLSPRPGPCDKDAKGMNGVVVESFADTGTNGIASTGMFMAHELGHYMGLPHTNSTNNLMNPSIGTANTVLTNAQGNTMKGFPCFVRFIG